VKELDHLDLLLQAREYEQKGHTNLDEFFRLHFEHPTTLALAQQIMADHKTLKESATVNGSKENHSSE